ncbi:sugar transporter [Flavobacterium columnare]|uniref:Polysaccharide exporter n=1 Tax=Flavobacterium columnare (strain ATCC 49512 / CIP 103533 / TG 44/87) TaxID=1041826 RepID=G8X9V7_FLACA|nr:polysaccharide biosynthesis/export family protein [Flavobacterium columnare]AEW87305.1 polysaccharide exporter precursor [Flavobacterium columnare ATCC 49512]ANO48362.1 polysaccharide exporter precursor [Flavobacterium columnare]MBF6652518.1 sugar transporter [Flavobacterium columnare]MBF6655532.1 sugar transporter [Flavobacterium columnare]MBF6658387.1 sugar transporter [Flavobacterium columnare]
MRGKIYLIIFGIISFFVLGCSQQKKIAYYSDLSNNSNFESVVFFEPKIQPDDLLLITVSAPDPEAAAPFNLESTTAPNVNNQGAPGQRQQQLYLVDQKNQIEFPVIGTLTFGGLKKEEAINLLKNKLKMYIKNPIVNIRIMNFKVSVIGEVVKPGSFNVISERITLPEALSLAGDLTIYGKRENLLLIRENEGKKTYHRIDLTKSDFMNSPYYYLKQNDLIYIEPNRARANASTFNQNIPVWISLSSVLISLVLLFKK